MGVINLCCRTILPKTTEGNVTYYYGASSSTSSGTTYSTGNGICIDGLTICADFGTSSTEVACGSHNHHITGLTDVNTSSLANGDLLYLSGSTWCNTPMIDILPNLSTGEVLYFNGTTISGCTINTTSFCTGTNVNNRVITATGSDNLNGEVNLTFNGSLLCVNGNVCASAYYGDGSNLSGISVATTLSDLTDTTISLPTEGDLLYYSGSAWCNTPLVDILPNLSTGEVLCYNGSTITGVNTVACAASATNALALCGCVPSCFATATHCHTNLYYSSSIKAFGVTNGICIVGYSYATDYVASSDIRLKTDITPITSALSIVNNLCGVYYKLKCTDECNIGMIAQDVLPVLPEVIGASEGFYGIKYDKLTALLIEAVKELKAEVDKLKGF